MTARTETGEAVDVLAGAAAVRAAGRSRRRRGRDPVNLATIRSWQEALGDGDPRYEAGGVAPPAMIQVWTMPGLSGVRADDDPLGRMTALLDAAGYTSVVATDCRQVYHRELRVGEQVEVSTVLGDVAGPKRTALGEGWFVTVDSTWFVAQEPVAEMSFRILKFRPAPVKSATGNTVPNRIGGDLPATNGPVARPVISRDTEFFWAGTVLHELRIQRCQGCGRLRHPPGPVCPSCGGEQLGYVVAAGTGTLHSFVVHHHPRTPGRTPPYVVALVELAEGVRLLGELLTAEPAALEIGLPVRLAWQDAGDGLLLPAWRPAPPGPETGASGPGGRLRLPRKRIEVTPTFIISTALATRDFQDVHHDRDAALARGSKDIFLNILTTTGLVQGYVAAWAGPQARITGVDIRLGVPCYAYETLVLSGEVLPGERGDPPTVERVRVVGQVGLGDHVTGIVTLQRYSRSSVSGGSGSRP